MADPAGVKLLDGDTGREKKRLVEHKGAVSALAFSPDGKRLAAGWADSMILVVEVGGD